MNTEITLKLYIHVQMCSFFGISLITFLAILIVGVKNSKGLKALDQHN